MKNTEKIEKIKIKKKKKNCRSTIVSKLEHHEQHFPVVI